MIPLQFKVSIQAPVSAVYEFMLGLNHKTTYEKWTSVFNPTSTYEGSWDKGSKILFLGVDEQGEKNGMVSRIVENHRNQRVSIQHYGLLKGNEEIIDGPEVAQRARAVRSGSRCGACGRRGAQGGIGRVPAG
jgi:glycogen debranching enzyme